MAQPVLTILHVVISLIGIVAGFVAAAGLLNSNLSRGWTILFLATTMLTSLTGFLFEFTRLLPSHIVALISLALLAAALFALYSRQLSGYWRTIYVVTALTSLYLNVFVLIIQAFMATIAAEIGYESEAAFSRAFKKMMGVPPSAWRLGARASAATA